MQYTPEWIMEIKEKYKTAVANAFILTGNIGDYCVENKDLNKYLSEYVAQKEANDMRMEKVYFYDVEAMGRRVYPVASDSKDESNIPWREFMELIQDGRGRNAFVFLYPQFLIPEDNKVYETEQANIVSLHRVLNSPEFINSNNTVFIITESLRDINQMFTGANSKTAVCEIPLPGEESRRAFIGYYLQKQYKKNSAYEQCVKNWPLGIDELVNLTAGLQLVAIEDVLLSAFNKERKKMEGDLPADYVCISRDMVMNRKKEVIQKEYGDVIEIFDTAGFNLDKFAGQDNMKNYFRDVVIRAFHDPSMADIAPKGIIMMGPPGTGKTFFARCSAGSAGINFLEFKMSKILGKYVGESEKSMERALSVFRALAPVGVFIDEIDQAFPTRTGGGTESSVNANLFGMLLAEMSKQENRGRILWLGATNYPNRVDEALKRSGRFDKKIPFFAPDAEERKAVFLLHLSKNNLNVDDEGILDKVVSDTDGYTQAEIEAVVVKTLELVKRSNGGFGTMEALVQAKNFMISAQNSNIRQMEDLALVECNDGEFIPAHMKERHMKLMHVNPDQSEISGTIDRTRTSEER